MFPPTRDHGRADGQPARRDHHGSLAPSTSIGSITTGAANSSGAWAMSAAASEIAARVGYADGATLRSLLRRRLNVGVKEIRKRAR